MIHLVLRRDRCVGRPFVKELDFQRAVDLSQLLRQYWVHKALKPETTREERKPTGH